MNHLTSYQAKPDIYYNNKEISYSCFTFTEARDIKQDHLPLSAAI